MRIVVVLVLFCMLSIFVSEKSYAETKTYEIKDKKAAQELAAIFKEMNNPEKIRAEAEGGDMYQMTNLAYVYLWDHGNYYDGIKWLKKSAEKGYVTAQYDLGIIFLDGKLTGNKTIPPGSGIEPDPYEAYKWLNMAALQGHDVALNLVGVMLAEGKHIKKDAVNAYVYFKLASRRGVSKSKENLEIVSGWLTPDEVQEAEKRAILVWGTLKYKDEPKG